MKRVIVVGNGIIGLSVAWRLRQRGAAVDVLAGPPEGQASRAAAGMLAPGAEITTPNDWTRLALASLASWREFVRELELASGGSIDYRNSGALELAFTEAEWSELRSRAREQRSLGIASREVGWPEASRMASGLCPRFTGALYYPGDGVVDPVDVMTCLRRLCPPSAGPANRVEADDVRVGVWTGGEYHAADAVVIAAGAWTSKIEVRVGGSLLRLPEAFPVRGHMLGYRLSPGLLGPILRRDHTYLVQRRSGFLVVGASQEEVGFDSEPDRNAIAALHLHAQQLLPGTLRGLTPESWWGFRPGIRAGAPFIGRLPEHPHLFAAYGHFRNGVLMAPETARRIADLVMG